MIYLSGLRNDILFKQVCKSFALWDQHSQKVEDRENEPGNIAPPSTHFSMIFYDNPFWCKDSLFPPKKCSWTQAKKKTAQACYLLPEIKLSNIASQDSALGCAVICKACTSLAKSLKSAMPTRDAARVCSHNVYPSSLRRHPQQLPLAFSEM